MTALHEPINDMEKAYELLFKANGAVISERDALAVRVRELEADAARYQFIRARKVYLEITSDGLYMATDTAGRYYADLREFDLDIDAAIDDLTTPESKP